MVWSIKCLECEKNTKAGNIVNLIEYHTDDKGYFLCKHCRKHGYIEKNYDLQEPGETWSPHLKGVIRLGKEGRVYQPFVFLVSYEPDKPPTDIWFSYYKDTRSTGGKLKMGHGPGGPPVLNAKTVKSLISKMRDAGVSCD